MMPYNADNLLALRQQHKRPRAVAIVPTFEMFNQVKEKYFPILVNRYAEYDFSMVWGLPVIYMMPDIHNAMDIAFQIAECDPSSLKLVYPDENKIVKVW